MGKFDGYLLLSDIDGTLTYEDFKISKENIDAIEYFKSEGGLFSLATGRLRDYLIRNGFSKLVNCPTAILNGAAIYDFNKDKLLYLKTLGDNFKAILDFIHTQNGYTAITMCMIDGAFHYEIGQDYSLLYKVKNPCKIVTIFNDEEKAIYFRDLLRQHFGEDFDVYRSWNTGVEIISKDADKGTAIEKIKLLTGATTTIGIGDFENDISLIKMADIGVCPQNALPELKDIAQIIVQSNKNNALADLINKL